VTNGFLERSIALFIDSDGAPDALVALAAVARHLLKAMQFVSFDDLYYSKSKSD